MKMKKLVAIGAAAAMSMAMCVNAFAAITVSSNDAKFGSYADGVAKLANVSAIDASHQWTVVIIDAEKDNANLQASDLYYINQGTSTEGFWVTNGMGTKVDLTTLVNETTTVKNFIIRIGGETITNADNVIEVPFKITYSADAPVGEKVTIIIGDVDGTNTVTTLDANYLVSSLAGGSKSVGGKYSIGQSVKDTSEKTIVFGDVDGTNTVTTLDANYIVSSLAGGNKSVGGVANIGSSYTMTVPTATAN